MSQRSQKALVFTLFVAVVGGLGLGYCELAYRNGSDLLKDGGLIAGVSAVTAAFLRVFAK